MVEGAHAHAIHTYIISEMFLSFFFTPRYIINLFGQLPIFEADVYNIFCNYTLLCDLNQ